jgi:lipopolysaccharide export system permease protein
VRILSRHYLASYLVSFAAALFVALLLVVVVEMLVNFDEIVEHRDAAGGVLVYLLLRVPAIYLRDLVPAASFAAAFLCFGLPARRHELTAIKSSGVAPQRLVVPVLLAATVLSGLALLLNETLLLETRRRFSHVERPGEPIFFGRGSFWYHRNAALYNVREADLASRTLRGVRIYQLDTEGRPLRSLAAEHVHIADASRWELRDASEHRFDPEAPFALPAETRHESLLVAVAGDADVDLRDMSEENLSLLQLSEAVDVRRRDGLDASRQRARLHERLAAPLSVLVFALVASPVGIAVDRNRNMAAPALSGIALIALFYAGWQVSVLLGESAFAFAAAGPWLTLVAFSLLGLALLARSPR